MRLSVSLTNYSWRDGLAAGLVDAVQAADAGGIDTVWVADHLIQADPFAAPGDTEHLEAYTTLGFLAAKTEQVRLGTMVSGVTFRPPSVLIKAVTTLDVLSGGRAWLGIGAGHQEDEAREMGLYMPSLGERFDRLEETVQIALRMWSDDDSAYNGHYFQLERPANSPRATTQPHPPILIGGTGERRTLPMVARYADACNVFDIPDGGATVRHKLDVLAGLCAEIGRPYDAIDKTISTRLEANETADAFVDRCAPFADYGLDHICVITVGPWTQNRINTLAEAVPALAELSR